MTALHETAEGREVGATRATLIPYSIIFLLLVGYGWYHLVHGSIGPVGALIVAFALAASAWNLARTIGIDSRGFAGNAIFFVMLLLISALGVLNTAIIQLEGKSIFNEAIDGATRRFGDLPVLMRQALQNKEVDALRARIAPLRTQLQQEIMNPRNCGEGPEAARIIEEIRKDLPGLVRYSGNARNCNDNKAIVDMYVDQIETLMRGSPIYLRNNVIEMETLAARVDGEVKKEVARLEQLRAELSNGASLFRVIRPKLEEIAGRYQALALDVKTAVPSAAADSAFPLQLSIESARNVGELGHLAPLVLARLDKLQTWFYIGASLIADVGLIALFARLATQRRRLPAREPVRRDATPEIGTPW
jgi:hypothetical protein